VCTALLGAVPALADGYGSSEQRTEKRSCRAKPDPHYSSPTRDDCKGKSKTYQATHYTNDVKCGAGSGGNPALANPTGVRLYGGRGGDPSIDTVRLSVCADGRGAVPNPVQGRVSVGGGPASGFRVVVDGDKDNPTQQAQGYLVVDGMPPAYRCGLAYGEGGKGDSDAEGPRDSSANCG
jgi:hypothetical protein